MNTTSKTLLGLLLAIATGTGACAAPADDSDPVADEAAVTEARESCTPEAYNAAFASYKKAVDNAKLHLRGEVCEEGTMLSDINNDLGAAVKTCGQFRSVIENSQWAQPVRDVLEGNLALPVLTGKMTVRDAGGNAVWTGLAESLPGSTIFGPAPGAYGNMTKVTFGEDGKATYQALVFDDETYEVSWESSPATYRISAPAADGSITITVKTAAEELELQMTEEPWGGEGPSFRLQPKDASEYEAFWSLPSECEA
jgi:hypothetical protein